MAEKAGVSEGHLSEVLTGRKGVSVAMIDKIIDAYHLDPSDLFRQLEPPTQRYSVKLLKSKDVAGEDAVHPDIGNADARREHAQSAPALVTLDARLDTLASLARELAATRLALERQIAQLGSISDAVADRAAGFVTRALEDQRRMAESFESRLLGILGDHERTTPRAPRGKR
jgi:transcriptional regulator with XRE-family HTH domain